MTNLNPGTQIIYIPMHAQNDEDHPDVEEGFVTSQRGDTVFCRYWSKYHSGLRTMGNSEGTPIQFIKVKQTRPQNVIDDLLIELGY